MKRVILTLVSSLLLIVSIAEGAQLTLTWTDTSNNEDGFRIEQAQGGCSNTFTQINQTGTNAITYTATGLLEGTDYCYRLKAFNAAGESAYSNTALGTTNATLTVTRAGGGAGGIVSTPSGISCGTVCSAVFPGKSTVTLTATASAGSTFTGWTGVCGGTAPTCVVTMDGTKAVTATFVLVTIPAAPTNLIVK